MRRLAVINVVGLTEGLIGEHTPNLAAFKQRLGLRRIRPCLPALTCSAQSTYLTGKLPDQHGIVANGWYNRELAEVQFWKQSNHLVQAPKVWEVLRSRIPGFTCAKLFWWYNMYSSVDYSITPRPMYPADGRKVFDIYTHPTVLRTEIESELGPFPFPTFWGPAAGVRTPQGPPHGASRWIAQSAMWIEERYQPTLNLIYLPHLDYNLQRLGPDHPATAKDLQRIDDVAGDLISFFEKRSVDILILSEYGITPVNRPVHINRLLRQAGWITIKNELGLELLDCGASQAFAVADHQIAHVYVRDPGQVDKVRSYLQNQPGIATILDRAGQAAAGLNHPRSGDLVLLADERAWFTYYYWENDALAPDFARTVDIHRKPGYDPVELFLNPALRAPKLRIAWRLLQKKLGFRMLMDVIPLDASLVKGSHGVIPRDPRSFPVLMGGGLPSAPDEPIPPTQVFEAIKSYFLRP